jgi:hypothetical protein
MKKLLLLTFLASCGLTSFAQETENEIKKDLRPFNRIVASPRVNLILKKGDKESIRLVYHDVSKSKINIEVNRRTLAIYLEGARKVEKPGPHEAHDGGRRSEYDGVSITAYVTYKDLEGLEIRGNQELTCFDELEAEEFRLKAYGENEITFTSLKTDFFKASLYGENHLKIKKGKVIEQKYKLYGENQIDTREMKSVFATASIFGEGSVKINTTEDVRLDAFGEPSVFVNGGGHVNKRFVIGKTSVFHE